MALRPGLLDSKNITHLQHDYRKRRPFPHLVVQNAIQDDILRQVRTEVNSNLRLKFDENNVYRVRRSTHLANLSNPNEYQPGLLPNLTHVRDTLNSLQFRQWLSSITGVGPLSGTRSSMAVNLYLPGDRLLIHDDCNPNSRDRRVSFILYMTDPDNPWKSEWGGGLRLYASEPKTAIDGNTVKVAEPTWSEYIQPCFNQLTFFGVRPGESYHEVEEVLKTGDAATDQGRQRMALSGWFHAAREGDEGFDEELYQADVQMVDHLHQLKAFAHGLHEPRSSFMPLGGGNTDGRGIRTRLTSLDVEWLSQYIVPDLLAQAQMENASRYFMERSFLHIQPFLSASFEAKMKNYIAQHGHADLTFEDPESTQWRTATPPDKQRYLYLEDSEASPIPDNPISQLLSGLLRSHQFQRWLAEMTGLELLDCGGQHITARHFRRGLDYILTDLYGQSPRQLDYTLDLTPTGCQDGVLPATEEAEANGGDEIYMVSENDGVELAFAGQPHPRTEAERGSYRSPPSWNKFSAILRRGHHAQGVVRYLSRSASGDRLDIKGRMQINTTGGRQGHCDRVNETVTA
ncbi:Oxoglutarate and iron-dependent oxygenase degradation C-term-domain-containing protein [Bombardia bombarda]|uniref:Oxoglutarate and iron-dependent oxygenase degradation C-term-domain-containing protein n=1 Tax=Bombardia bombarda TaxID=252184 RepID=A0AA39WGH5_9PEZI|nr:Oxoglutarate and iron-dependent oxygenase degradation C-term-domain-containing protein [Bombardia bombarda]